jgi:hypothetical protein
MTQSTHFEGRCYGCGKSSFCEFCDVFPLPVEWFSSAVTKLQHGGWTFVREDNGVPRAYCGYCKEKGNLKNAIERGWVMEL